MKVEGYVIKYKDKYATVQNKTDCWDDSIILRNHFNISTEEEKNLAVELLGEKAEIFTIHLKRVHRAGQSFPEWVRSVEQEFHVHDLQLAYLPDSY